MVLDALHPPNRRGQNPRQTWASPSLLFSLGLVAWEAYSGLVISPLSWVPLCGTVCVPVTLHCPHTLVRMSISISTCIYVYLTLHVCSTPLCIVKWKHGFLCVVMYMYCSHPTSGHTPWLECVYASVHVFMSV